MWGHAPGKGKDVKRFGNDSTILSLTGRPDDSVDIRLSPF